MYLFYMKRIIFLFFALLSFKLQAQTKHALIVAIGDYKFWDDISSTNDVPYIKSALLKQEFAAANINILTDTKATKAGIESGFKSLIAKVQPGDIVLIHFSSHGEQIEDNNKEEIDGLDESIVTWDAPKLTGSQNFAKEQGKYFRDDLLGMYITQLRSKLGRNGDVVVFMDACHSGTGTRGNRKVRGNEKPLVSKTFKAPPKTQQKSTNVLLETNNAAVDFENLASFVLVSAALAEEKNTESEYPDGKEGGSLSIAMCKVFENLKPGTTYRSLYAGILSILNDIVPDQHPVIEGDGIDRILFGGKFVVQKPYVEIEEIADKKLILKGGVAMGLDSGAKVSLYPSGSNDPATATLLATGVITGAEPFRSSVLLDKSPGIIQPADGWVFITEPAYRISPLAIELGTVAKGNATLNFSEKEVEAIKIALKEIPLVQFAGKPELILAKGAGKDSVKIAGNGYVFATVKSADNNELKGTIQRYVQSRFLQKLELSDTNCKMEVKLVPFVNRKPDTAAIAKNMVNGIFEINVGDSMVVWVKNTSDIPLYLNILDIQPDGIINPIFPITKRLPQKSITPAELKIEAGEEKLLGNFKIAIGPPIGLEVFKIFVSATMIDMEKVANRDVNTRGNFSFLQKLVDKSYNISTRGNVSAGVANGTVYTMLFRINPAAK
jgi:metacaspase-1